MLNEDKDIKVYLYILLFYEILSSYPGIIENKNNSESKYSPISLIISSHYENVDFFKELLEYFYRIIKFDTSILYNFKEKRKIKNSLFNKDEYEKIKNFQKLEILNYLNFCCLIPRPPNQSIMTLEMRFDKIKYKFQSLKEIPTSDYCIEVLFDTLEITVIIKLFIALLFEKQIIILANQNMPLFCICESILRLIFPFRWLYTYIPNLPKESKDILDLKRPYLIGMISEKNTASDLNSKYPSNIICDVNSSTLFGNISNLKLPLNEEMKIKRKLLLLKDKYKNNYDEFDLDDNINDLTKKDSIDKYEDVDFNLSFAENVHNIFFKIFKNNLMDIKKDFIVNEIFESQQFLNSFNNEEYKLFFEKIIVTSAFDYFISSMRFLDNSLSMRFNLIYNFADNRLKGKVKNIHYYNYSISIPKKINFSKKRDIINITQEKKDKYILSVLDNYNEISSIIDENSEKYMSNSGISINEYFKNRNSNQKNMKYSSINFYGEDGLIEFANDYNEYINYNNNKFLIEDALVLYKNIISNDIINRKTNIIKVPNIDSYQLNLLVALYLYNFLVYENTKRKINDNDNNNDYIINFNDVSYTKKKSIIIQSRKNNANKQILNSSKYKDNIITKEMIFNLFLKAYRKNNDQFPRNLFITILKMFSLKELKELKPTNIIYIDKTIQFQILKIQQISYESLVIKDIDNEDKNRIESLDLELNNNNSEELLSIMRNVKKRKTSLPLKFIPLNQILTNKVANDNEEILTNKIELNDESQNENFPKTKLNVLGDNNKYNELNESKQQIADNSKQKFITKKNTYRHQKRYLSGLKSWNNIQFQNNSFLGRKLVLKNNIISDPIKLSEKICIQLYSFLYTKKIDNFTEKNNDINFLEELAHCNTFEEIKHLITSLKHISLDNLSNSKNKYYCFWLNLYNFLTIFAVIYKCEIISNLYEWIRFLKNSYFTIGNIEISLLEIEAYILRNETIIKNIYGVDINNEQINLPNIDKFDSIINYGISLPTISSPDIRIYFPSNFIESLKYNAFSFFSKNINIQEGIIEIPEYIKMIEPNFNFNTTTYNKYFEEEFLKKVNENPYYEIKSKNYNWNLNFANFKNY